MSRRNILLVAMLILALSFSGCFASSTLKSLVLTGDANQINQGESVNLEVKGFDQKNKEVTIPRLEWESVDASKGTLVEDSNKAVFTAAVEASGQVVIKAVAGKISDSFTITITSETTPDPIEVDLSELEAVITSANALITSIGKGEELGQAPETAHAAFQTAIDAAQDVYDNADATQEQVNSAVSALNTAIGIFNEAIVEEVEPPAVDKTDLIAAIADAEALKNTPAGIYNGQAPVHAHAVLQAAIDAATLVNDDAEVTQEAVDQAVIDLLAANTTFESEIVTTPDPLKVHTYAIGTTTKGIFTSNDRASIEINEDLKYIKSGTTSLHLAATGAPFPLRVRVAHPNWIEDWTEYDHLAAWFYIDDIAALNEGTAIQVGYGTDAPLITMKRSEFVSGWNEIVLSLRDEITFTDKELAEMTDLFEFIIRFSEDPVPIYFDEIRLLKLEEDPIEVVIFKETFNSMPDGGNIRPGSDDGRVETLDNPDSFIRSHFSGTISAFDGVITIGTQRFSMIIPDLKNATNPLLRLTIKNETEGMMIRIGNEHSTSGGVGVSGQRAHGEHPLAVTDSFIVMDIPLDTNFINTDLISFRAVVGGSGTAGIFIDQIEVIDRK